MCWVDEIMGGRWFSPHKSEFGIYLKIKIQLWTVWWFLILIFFSSVIGLMYFLLIFWLFGMSMMFSPQFLRHTKEKNRKEYWWRAKYTWNRFLIIEGQGRILWKTRVREKLKEENWSGLLKNPSQCEAFKEK